MTFEEEKKAIDTIRNEGVSDPEIIMRIFSMWRDGKITYPMFIGVLAITGFSFNHDTNWKQAKDLGNLDKAVMVVLNCRDIRSFVNSFISKINPRWNELQPRQCLATIAISEYNCGYLGIIDVKHIIDALELEPDNELSQTFEAAKRYVRSYYGIEDYFKALKKEGCSEEECRTSTVDNLYDDFQHGKYSSAEKMDLELWSVGYEASDRFLLMNKKEQMKDLYVQDEDRNNIGMTIPVPQLG
jgi:hypothetical protein